MIYYTNYLKDSKGFNYLGISLPNNIIEPYLNEMKEIVGEEKFNIFTERQKNRDRGLYHITIINPMEYEKLTKKFGLSNFIDSLELIFKYEIDDINMLGIGTSSKGQNITYYVVCESDKLDAIRNRFDLPKQDFHITLGFDLKDVFGVRKNIIIK